MRTRIKRMRERLVALLDGLIPGRDFSFIASQNGMFSYSGLTSAQVEDLQVESGIYASAQAASVSRRSMTRTSSTLPRRLRTWSAKRLLSRKSFEGDLDLTRTSAPS